MSTSASAPLIVIDASVWVSRFVPQDVHHLTSQSWLDQYIEQSGRLISPAILLAEIAGAISRRTGERKLAQQIVTRMQQLPGLQLVFVDRRLGQVAAELAAELSMRGADAIYVALARELAIPLLSWDNEQITKASSVVQAFTPDSLPGQVFR